MTTLAATACPSVIRGPRAEMAFPTEHCWRTSYRCSSNARRHVPEHSKSYAARTTVPGFIVHENAVIFCMHGGTVRHVVSIPPVTVSGLPIVVMPYPHSISGCPLLSPCVAANWVTAATRVTSFGKRVLLKDSQAVCPAPGTSVNIVWTQARVKAI